MHGTSSPTDEGGFAESTIVREVSASRADVMSASTPRIPHRFSTAWTD